MKIGIVCYPTYGGSGVLATELGIGLAQHGHDVHFITYSQPVRLTSFQSNVYYHEVTDADYPLFQYPPYDTALASKLVDVVQYEKLDLLHVHYAIPHATVAYMAKKILLSQGYGYIPVITTLHGTDITLVGQSQAFSPVVEFAINKSDGVTAVSHALKQQTLYSFNIKNDIHVIYNFIDLERFKRGNKEHFKKAIAPDNEKILIHISNFRKVKRTEDVVQIFKQVHDEMPSKLLLVGDGPERGRLGGMCRDLGLTKDVIFLGKQEAVEELLAISDVFIMPSESESFGLAALEAMACEVPVISSNVGGLPEVNEHGVTGYLSDVGNVDEMAANTIQMLKNEEKFQQMRQNARKKAEQFNIENILPKYESYYERILAESLHNT